MYIDKIFIQDNFVPDIMTDQFRRKVIGVNVCLKEGEDTAEAEAFAENYIAEYIQRNTVAPRISGISSVADNTPVPIVQVEKESETKLTKEQRQKNELVNCTTVKELETFAKLVKSYRHLQETYDTQLKILSNGN